ncbi:Cobyrinic acid A,C-diamide synthase [Acidisarcina polymorpha]|uniref:Cobyrinate a,c-diamide synthase n=1 Tax=Acidisarcina polymorpha TaxID=2211140 RepID=A0A2Z5G6J1_9BACT|nr:cobyrinate a,c-diamide synthase [Acidisarcina polymorpha]AXC14407.1 Cobyrinic acid A,C-diamide synthase [Acidisarcina polymorpha]
MKGFLIAGTSSGVGKTTVAMSITAALRHRGYTVQPFKGGPDFLDTGHHTRISGRIARNLDTWMLSKDANCDVLQQASVGADILLVEGMMGLYDGKDGGTEAGSSAEIAKLLRLPVVLVLDASKSARSIAAVVLGFELFDPELHLAGVILNRVASGRHFEMLRTAIASSCKTPILGWLPREPAIAIPERHLGLYTPEESETGEPLENLLDQMAALVEQHLDMDRLLTFECGLDWNQNAATSALSNSGKVRIGVARDRAFSFYYEDNLDLLRRLGAMIVPFSPLEDTSLPPDLDGLYLGGGYPELYAGHLASNSAMLDAVRSFAASGRPVYAECGGMIFLSQQLTTLDGAAYPMAGLLPFAVEMTRGLVNFGYVTVELAEDCLLGHRGQTIRGHSFHHSRIVNEANVKTRYRVRYSLSGREEDEGYWVANVLASYIHLHFRAQPSIALSLVEAALASQSNSLVSS